MSLNIASTSVGDVAVLECDGRLVLGDLPLIETVRTLVEAGAKDVLLDLTGVGYMDSSGIGSLVSAYTFTRNSGGNLVLAGLTKKVRDLLTITKLISVFEVFDNRQAALEHLRPAVVSEVRDDAAAQGE